MLCGFAKVAETITTWLLRVSQCGIFSLFVPAGQIGAVACPLSRLARSVIRNICCELGSVGPVSGCMALKALAQCGDFPLHHMECPGAPPLDSAEMVWHCLNWSLPAACGAQDNMRLAMS